jgi:hypothetical protein
MLPNDLKIWTLTSEEELINRFDFESVRNLMVINKWTWGDAEVPPTVDEMKQVVHELIKTLANSVHTNNRLGRGGFRLYRFQWDATVELELTFYWRTMSIFQ